MGLTKQTYQVVNILLVCALTSAAVLSESYLSAAVIGMSTLWLLGLLVGHPLWRHTPADWAILLMALTLPAAFFVSPNKEISTPQILRLLVGILLFNSIVQWCITKDRIKYGVVVVTIIGLALALLAFYVVQWPLEKWKFVAVAIRPAFSRRFSDVVHPNVMAGYLVFLLPMVIAIPMFGWSELTHRHKIFYIICTIGILTVLVLTKSRGALTALVISLAFLVVLRWRSGWIAIAMLGLVSWLMVQLAGTERLLTLLLPPIAGIDVIQGRIDRHVSGYRPHGCN